MSLVRTSHWTALLLLGLWPALATSTSSPARPFDAADWNLAWQAFIGAGDVTAAYALAQSATKARPDNRLWWERLAQAARWSSHSGTALTALSKLALDFHDTNYLEPALELASGLAEKTHTIALLRELIRLGRATPAQRHQLARLYLDIGEPEQALEALAREYQRHPSPELAREQAAIYRMIGDPEGELAILQQSRKRFGPSPQLMLAIATQEYVQGRLQQALEDLLAAKSRAQPTDIAYWETLSGLAWALGRYQLAAHAAQVLIDTGKGDITLYQRAVYVLQYTRPEQAFAIAARGWQQTHTPSLFMTLLGIASAQQPAQPWLARAFAMLDTEQAKRFADIPFYWASLATLQASQGKTRAARASYRHALQLAPDDNALLAGYVWLLLDTDDTTAIRSQLPHLVRRAKQSSSLWAPLAAAYIALEQPGRALPWQQKLWPTHKDDPVWLLDYADTLVQSNHTQTAWQMRRRAYTLWKQHSNGLPGTEQTTKQLRTLARLATTLAPGDPARRTIERLSHHPDSREARIIVLAWMLDTQAYPLARWWKLRAFMHQPPPAWALLSLALAGKDGPELAKLLEHQSKQLPVRDRVTAANQLGWDSLALDLAWTGLENNPEDTQLQNQFNELALAHSDHVGMQTTLTQGSGLYSLGLDLNASHWLTPSDRLDLNLDAAQQNNTDTTLLGIVPVTSNTAQLTWQHTLEHGGLSFTLGNGSNLHAWTYAGAEWEYQWDAHLHTRVSAAVGARPTDNVPLSLGGLEDHIRAVIDLSVTPRLSGQLQLGTGVLRAQGGGTLGKKTDFTLNTDYRLWFTPPEFTLSASLSGAQYNGATKLPGQLVPLVPAGQSPTVSFFIPQSFIQACTGAHFNTRYASDYTGRLRPFAHISICSNSVSGNSYDLGAGLALPVTTSDHLALNLSLQHNPTDPAGQTAQLMLDYRFHFTPLH